MTTSKLFNAVYGVHIDGSIMGTHEQEILARNKKSATRKALKIAWLLQRIEKINKPKTDYWYRLEELYECGKEVK